MYEAIITAVGTVLAGIFPAMIHERKKKVRDLEIRMEMLERSLGIEMQRSGAKCRKRFVFQV